MSRKKMPDAPPPFERGVLLATMLHQGKAITTETIREKFGVSRATAKRDLLALESLTWADADVGENRQVTLRRPSDRRYSAAIVVRGHYQLSAINSQLSGAHGQLSG